MSPFDKTPPVTLDDETNALSIYLDALLAETDLIPQEISPESSKTEIVPVFDNASEVKVDVELDVQVDTGGVVPQPMPSSVEVLMFKVAGLSLAIPLLDLSGVEEWGDVVKIPGHPPWSLGLMTYGDKNVPIIDIAQLVVPKSHLDKLTTTTEERVKRIVFIDDGRWGLACDAVNDVLTLSSQQIRWRASRANRKWLAGTVIEHMCALLDANELAAELSRENKLKL